MGQGRAVVPSLSIYITNRPGCGGYLYHGFDTDKTSTCKKTIDALTRNASQKLPPTSGYVCGPGGLIYLCLLRK